MSLDTQNNIIKKADEISVGLACRYLQEGKIIAFPTETVYALAVSATNSDAIRALYKIKKRPENKPFQIMVSSLKKAKEIAIFNEQAENIAKGFWAGAITLILPISNTAEISSKANAGLDSIGIRIPDYPIAMDILKKVDMPIITTSANISSKKPLYSANDVYHEFGGDIPLIIDSGETEPDGVASTIIDCTKNQLRILREGKITKDDIANYLT